ncbi:MAG: nucleotidyltransferase domain-containing protein [Planctomycetota bacterium]
MARRIVHNPNMILSAGTKVVLRDPLSPRDAAAVQPAGAVGVIIKSPMDQDHAYRVRFPDGSEAPLCRTEFTLLKHVQADAAGGAVDALGEFELSDCVIYRCIVGSRAYGLASDESDTDRRGIYLPPAEMHWSLYGVSEQLENLATEEAYWELQKFIVLALKANPNVLECLYTPLVEHATPLAEELRAMRGVFLSKLVYQTYNGYVLSQFKKLDAHLSRHGTIKWKHAMHLIRLLLSGITALREGRVPVSVEEHRAQLLAIRDGTLPWKEINAWRLALHREFDAAYAATKLPDRPDYERANGLLIKARRSMVVD